MINLVDRDLAASKPTHVETGKQIFNKYHAVVEFNDAGKIVYVSEFWDASGIQVQLDS